MNHFSLAVGLLLGLLPLGICAERSGAHLRKTEQLAQRSVMAPPEIDFGCIAAQKGGGFQPVVVKLDGKETTQFPPLGRKGISKEECDQVVANANHGIVCSHTLIGWKPTHYSGFVEDRRDLGQDNHGFYGSSLQGKNAFSDCLKATKQATAAGVCFYGGDRWYIGHVSGARGVLGGGYASLDKCLEGLGPDKAKLGAKEMASPFRLASDAKSQTEMPQGHWYGSHCGNCHGKEGIHDLPDYVKDTASFESRLHDGDPGAIGWARALHVRLNEVGDMPPSHRNEFRNEPGVSEYRKLVAKFGKRPEIEAVSGKGPAMPQIVSQDWLDFYRRSLPQVEDPILNEMLQSKDLFFYDSQTLPHAYQDSSTPVVGVRQVGDVTVSPSAPFLDKKSGRIASFGHAVGIDPNSTSETFHFLWLPRDQEGNIKKIKVSTKKDPRPIGQGLIDDWVFPVGTVSGEAIYTRGSDNKGHVLELRIRKKSGEGVEGWSNNFFRPVVNAEDLSIALKEIADSKPGLKAEALNLIQHVEKTPLRAVKIEAAPRMSKDLAFSGYTQDMPDISAELTTQILDRPFRSALGGYWKKEGEQTAFAPTTKQGFSFVPQHSTLGALRVDSASCNRCHAKANTPVYELFPGIEPTDNFLARDTALYGNTPGTSLDGNLRFHIYDPSWLGKLGNVTVGGDNRVVDERLTPILDLSGYKKKR